MTSKLLESVEINPERDPAYVVIWLHGLGADGHDFEAIVPELHLPESLPIRYVFPHAPTRPVTINMGMVMRAWYDILEMDVSRKVDLDNIVESSLLLRNLIQHELDAGMPSEKILLAGFSQGGAIVLHTALRYEKPLAGLLALSTYLPTVDSLGSERNSANGKIPIMMAHGQYDPMIPIVNAENTREALTHLNYTVQWHAYPMEHQVCMEEIKAIRAWMLSIMQPHQ
jgi:phospholipase/carboxylesterase